MKLKLLSVFLVAAVFLTSCTPANGGQEVVVTRTEDFVLIADTTARGYLGEDCNEGLLKDFRDQSGGVCIKVIYKEPIQGYALANSATTPKDKPGFSNQYNADSFLAVDGAWLNGALKNPVKIASSPVVFGVDSAQAAKIGWELGSSHTLSDAQKLMSSNDLNPVVCSARRCPTGALFFSTIISSLKGLPGDVLSENDVEDERIINLGKEIYGHLKTTDSETEAIDIYGKDSQYNALVVLEVNANTVNENLIKAGKNPLIWFYLSDGTLTANPTIGCLEGPDMDTCKKFQAFMTSETSQKVLGSLGWRPAIFGVDIDPSRVRAEWGLSANPTYAYIPSPTAKVMATFIDRFIALYRTPTQMVICGDDSGSMDNNGGKTQFNQAMVNIFDLNWASQYNIQPGPQDETTVMLFGGDVYTVGTLTGNNPEEMAQFGQLIINSHTWDRSHTAIYECTKAALNYLKDNPRPESNQVIVLMTDGAVNWGINRQQFLSEYQAFELNVSITSIAFGFDAEGELGYKAFGQYVNGNYFRGDDLIAAFEKIRGGN